MVAETRRQGDETLLAVTITAGPAKRDVVAEGRRLVARALESGYSQMLGRHEAWWRDFWRASRIELPELDLWRHYYLVQYFYGAASRRGAPPIPLQGVWTADNGELPPWKGDYHHDLNTEMTYVAYQTAGRFDEGLCFLESLWKLLPEFRAVRQAVLRRPGRGRAERDDVERPTDGRLGNVFAPADQRRLARISLLRALALHDGRGVSARSGVSLVCRRSASACSTC